VHFLQFWHPHPHPHPHLHRRNRGNFCPQNKGIRPAGYLAEVLMREEGSWWWKGDKVEARVKGAIEQWKAQVPKSYRGALGVLEDKEVYGLVHNQEMMEAQFLAWVGQVAWDAAENLLQKNMKELEIEKGWNIVKQN
jgi:hypothetical protein